MAEMQSKPLPATGEAYLYACDVNTCRVLTFLVLDTHFARCPNCNTLGRFIRRPVPKREPRPYV